jgi:hypothetical protein
LSLTELELETKVVRDTRPPASAMAAAQAAKADKLAKATPKIEIPETQVTMSLTGVAPTDVEISEYMSNLGHHPLFDDVLLIYSEQHQMHETPLRKFKIQLALERELTMAELEPTRVSRELTHDPLGDSMQITPQGPVAN